MVNRGKQFEAVIRTAMEKVPEISVDRIHDQTTGFRGSKNICDFIVYRWPYQYYIECKSVHGKSLSFSNITETQWKGLLQKSKIRGVYAGIICWFIDKDVTLYIPIQELDLLEKHGWKSIPFNCPCVNGIREISGQKKRVFFDYDMKGFFNDLRQSKNRTSERHTVARRKQQQDD